MKYFQFPTIAYSVLLFEMFDFRCLTNGRIPIEFVFDNKSVSKKLVELSQHVAGYQFLSPAQELRSTRDSLEGIGVPRTVVRKFQLSYKVTATTVGQSYGSCKQFDSTVCC